MVSVSNHETPPPKRAHWRRTPFERRVADFRRWLIRNRMLLRSAAIAFALGLIAGSLALGLPRAIADGIGLVKTALGGKAGLKLELVTVSGLKHLKQGDVAEALGIAKDVPLLDIDVVKARARVLALGWVKDADVVRVPPDRLHVAITEYEPAILWRDKGRDYAVDAFGHVIAPADAFADDKLLHISGEAAPEAAGELAEWLAAFPEIRARLKSAERVGRRRWNLHLSNQLVVELPDRGLDAALAALMRMILEEDLLKRDVDILDLRNPKTPRFKLGKDAARALGAPAGKS